MGFMGINHWVESDNAADFHAHLQTTLNTSFRNELRNKANEYNTPGWLNALLIFKETPGLILFLDNKILDSIEEKIEKDLGYLKGKDGGDLVRNFRATRYLRKRDE